MGSAEVKIALCGAGGMSFGPVMAYDAMHAKRIRGSALVLYDMDPERLEPVAAAARRMNQSMGEPIIIETATEPDKAFSGADFVLISAEKRRWESWRQDFEIPLKHGARHITGENGGPGAVFHSARSIRNVLSICAEIRDRAPNAFVVNLTNPMSRVTLALARHAGLKHVGLCHEFFGGLMRLAFFLLMPPAKIKAEAAGMNHFTWFHSIRHAETDEDLYPRLERHVAAFPWLHHPLVRDSFRRYGLYCTTGDSHVGEYLPHAAEVKPAPKLPYNRFHAAQAAVSEQLIKLYAKGFIPIPAKHLPESGEEAFPIIEALATGEGAEINAVNQLNAGGFIPNLPEDMIVEVPARADGDGIHPKTVPAVMEPLAQIMRDQHELQSMIVEASVKGDAGLAFEALKKDPHSPDDEAACRRIFDELHALQADLLPF